VKPFGRVVVWVAPLRLTGVARPRRGRELRAARVRRPDERRRAARLAAMTAIEQGRTAGGGAVVDDEKEIFVWSKIEEEEEDDYVISRNCGLRPSEMEEADCT
jgi:hypothetical protein